MDWARDHRWMSRNDREKLFTYTSDQKFRQTTVISALDGQLPTQVILDSNAGRSQWLEEACPRPDSSRSGTIVILAGRDLGGETPRRTNDAPDDLNLGGLSIQISAVPNGPHDQHSNENPMDYNLLHRYRRGLRSLPFSADTFRHVMKSLFIHGDIARVISRADIPTFFVSEITMGDWPAHVIQLRTTNALGVDLAMSCTFFPHCNLTFAIVFGSTPTVDTEITKRITLASEDAAHPLLVAGIILELQRTRHAGIVENSIDKLEAQVLALDSFSTDMYDDQSETARKNIAKRNEWLDMAYLRNQLVGWNIQILRFIAAAESLNQTVFSTEILAATEVSPNRGGVEDSSAMKNTQYNLDWDAVESSDSRNYIEAEEAYNQSQGVTGRDRDTQALRERLHQTGSKFAARCREISDEYDNKIRDCKMRLEGMAMANQWANSETDTTIALEMKRDSRHMRSIALVTMIFLPSTFFATVFSMTFFNWLPDSSRSADPTETSKPAHNPESVVSSKVWICVVFTLLSAAATLLLWYYCIVYRDARARKLRAKNDSESKVA
ncbi:hypothetical protein B0T14DRAFT_518561 [Immersiella caudata]|uniref:Uncharacterized protein n=1 Tax=Immersiella caudata TaxID=314043 RepID=A0AA39WPB1_9PEZI|nr:hypothetical protein B0T14DRAFT_518561 [Immersiella caudata]